MKLHVSMLFGILFLFLSIVILPNVGFTHYRPDLLAILCIHVILTNDNDESVLVQSWLLGLLKDSLSTEIFGLQSFIFVLFSFILIRVKQTLDFENRYVVYLFIVFYTFQYQLLHSMIVFVLYDVDLTMVSVKSTLLTLVVSPVILLVLEFWTPKSLL